MTTQSTFAVHPSHVTEYVCGRLLSSGGAVCWARIMQAGSPREVPLTSLGCEQAAESGCRTSFRSREVLVAMSLPNHDNRATPRQPAMSPCGDGSDRSSELQDTPWKLTVCSRQEALIYTISNGFMTTARLTDLGTPRGRRPPAVRSASCNCRMERLSF